jgi:hypothetical protein
MAEVKFNFALIGIENKSMTTTRADQRSIKYFLKKLNSFLDNKEFDIGKFGRTLKRFEKRFNFKIGVIDFKYFDENRLKNAQREKLKGDLIKNFQYFRSQRRLERVCQQYLELKTQFDIDKSIFMFEENVLMYCHFGTSKNDPAIMQWILHDERYVKLNIRV